MDYLTGQKGNFRYPNLSGRMKGDLLLLSTENTSQTSDVEGSDRNGQGNAHQHWPGQVTKMV